MQKDLIPVYKSLMNKYCDIYFAGSEEIPGGIRIVLHCNHWGMNELEVWLTQVDITDEGINYRWNYGKVE